jgi:hypothetical protein
MTNPAKCHCGSISWERNIEESRYICASCKRPLWQPIETAPKDGRTILVYGHWAVDNSVPDIAFAYWDDDARFWIFDAEEMLTMLYWMNLPEPPRHD